MGMGMGHVRCKIANKVGHARKIEWLRTFYQNSIAHHERSILQHSKHHQERIQLLTNTWNQNKSANETLREMTLVQSPGPYPGSVIYDFDAQDYMGVLYYADEVEMDRMRHNQSRSRSRSQEH